MHLQENTLFYRRSHEKFAVAASNGLVEYTITRNVMDGQTDAQMSAPTSDQTQGQTHDGLTLVRNYDTLFF